MDSTQIASNQPKLKSPNGFVIPPILGAMGAARGEACYPQGFGLFVVLAAISLALAALFKQAPAPAPRPRAPA